MTVSPTVSRNVAVPSQSSVTVTIGSVAMSRSCTNWSLFDVEVVRGAAQGRRGDRGRTGGWGRPGGPKRQQQGEEGGDRHDRRRRRPPAGTGDEDRAAGGEEGGEPGGGTQLL